jgi:hypothetical protein
MMKRVCPRKNRGASHGLVVPFTFQRKVALTAAELDAYYF